MCRYETTHSLTHGTETLRSCAKRDGIVAERKKDHTPTDVYSSLRVWFTRYKFLSRLRFALSPLTSARVRGDASNCRPVGVLPDRARRREEILPDPVAICRFRLIIVARRSGDRWPTRRSHNVKKTDTANYDRSAAHVRRRKSFVNFPPDILSPIWRRHGG